MPRIITDFLDEAVAAVPEKTAFVEEKDPLLTNSLERKLTKLQCLL